ncbi:MAG: hypothetical protein LQ345_004130 [Seirophora villosa]|nr:MAG: hypothetical protein LQ345_004130 [Seirophora villosa]
MAFRPQRFSLASSKSSMTWGSHESSPPSDRSSVSSRPSFTSIQSMYSISLPSPPLSPSYNSASITQRKLRSTAPPPPVFQRLPPEIYDCILRQLTILHDKATSMSCETCRLRDLCALALVDRRWDRAVRPQLYRRVYIVGIDSPLQAKKFRMKSDVRLKLLRRTLRERRVLAQHVREIKVPRLQPDGEVVEERRLSLVASLVMVCPNLEKLVGFYPVFGHNFDRLTYALSTRTRLKEHVWIIGENSAITGRSRKQVPPGLMDVEQVDRFLHLHDAWDSLSTLFLFSHKQGVLERDVFVQTLRRLPSLQRLCISNFDMDDFDDVTLQTLPPLHSLRLQDLEGVTFWGLSEFSRTRSSQCIRQLSLIHLDVKYLSAISNLLLRLTSLQRFTLVQESSPEVVAGELVFQPVIASQHLQYMHWNILLPGSANENLAKSIRAGGFPSLRTLRAPSDHDGLLQMVCRPRAQIIQPSDKYSKAYRAPNESNPDNPAQTLFTARKQAQRRIEEARKSASFRIVIEEDGIVQEVFDIEGFMGTVGSKISYTLDSDVPGSDNALIDLPDLVDGSKEVAPRDGCTGMWNASHHAGKKWWNHTERYRYHPIDLQRFF